MATLVLSGVTTLGTSAPPATAGIHNFDRQCVTDDKTNTALGSESRCVNGRNLRTRGTINDDCLKGATEDAGRPLASDVCGKSPERVAQARFVKFMSDALHPSDLADLESDEVTGGVQFEPQSATAKGAMTHSGRADVITYQPGNGDPRTTPVDVWELKGAWNSDGVAGAKTQLNRYVAYYRSAGRDYQAVEAQTADSNPLSVPIAAGSSLNTPGWAARPGVPFGYEDRFLIERTACPQVADPLDVGEIDSLYVHDLASSPGVLWIDRETISYPCTDPDTKTRRPGTPAPNERTPGTPPKDNAGKTPGPLEPIDPDVPEDPNKPKPDLTLDDIAKLPLDDVGFLSFCVELRKYDKTPIGSSGLAAPTCSGSKNLADLLTKKVWKEFWDSLTPAQKKKLLEEVGYNVVEEGVEVGADLVDRISDTAQVSGDPHLVTLDGLNYDLQSVGEFAALDLPDQDVELQARFGAAGPNQSSITAIAFNLDDHVVELRANGDVIIDGLSYTVVDQRGFFTSGGGYLTRDGAAIRVGTPPDANKQRLLLQWTPRAGAGALALNVPTGWTTVGLLGDHDGDPTDDLRLRDGTLLPVSTSAQVLHGTYADSWRLSDGESLFTYTEGQSTATFTDLSFPQEIVTIGDFSAEQRAQAAEVCRVNGVRPGPSFEDCELDILVTGNWSFAAAAAAITIPSMAAGDTMVDASGHLAVDFEGAVSGNFRPLRVGNDATLTAFAGPLSGTEQYRFYVPGLPYHDQMTVAVDLIAVGEWDTTDTLLIAVDGGQPAVVDLTAATTGTLTSGVSYRTVRVVLPVEHHREQLAVTVSATGLDAAAGQGFAVDDIEVDTRQVPAQRHPVTLGTEGVPTALRAPGLPPTAGVLETRGSRDEFAVTVPAGRDLYLDWQTSSASVAWTLRDAQGAVVAGDVSGGDTRLEDLAGDYVLTVEPAGATPAPVQTYSVDLMVAPDPQQFTVELPGPVSVPDDLPSPGAIAGAGNLETKASVDQYAFTIAGQDRDVVIDPVSCPMDGWRYRLNWTLLDDNGVVVTQGRCGRTTLEDLDAGQYRLNIHPEREVTGTYRLVLTQQGPVTSFTVPPPTATNQRTSTWFFEADDPAATFECAIDAPSYAGPFTTCVSPKVIADLADGEHTIRVRARDTGGNLGPATTHRVTVDTVAPNMRITRKPSTVSNITGPVLEYAGDKPGMTYQCSLVPVGSPTEFEACDGVSVYRDLVHGTYRFSVIGTDYVGNESTVSYDFAVDLQPPNITLTPPSNLTSTTSPTFTFTADETATYECSLVPVGQSDAFTACTSPRVYTGLTSGTQYRFFVRATDVAGQWSARGVTWTPYAQPPTVTLTSKPAASSSNAAPQFAFSTNITNPTFECSLELSTTAAVFSPCTSPKGYTGKAPGTYKFTVKAIDGSGSWVSTTYQFAITAAGDTTAPSTPGTPTATLAAGTTVGADTDTPASGAPIQLAWTASTDNAGVTGYEVWSSANGATFTQAGTVTGTTVTMTLPPGTTSWRFQVKAKDAAGNTATSAVSAATVVGLTQETASSSTTYSGTWTGASATASSGGTTRYSTSSTASVTFRPATGTTQVAVVMATGPAAGRASISIDGGTATTVELYSATAGQRRVVLASGNLSATTAHTIVVKPLGTKHTSSTSTRVDVDALVTRR